MNDSAQSHWKIERFVFWFNVLSIHQSAFVRALASDFAVSVAYEEDLPANRTGMGWTIPDFGNAEILDVRNATSLAALLDRTDNTTCHAFGNYQQLPMARMAHQSLSQHACSKVWITEAYDFHGWKGRIRKERMRLRYSRRVNATFDRVFAMGKLGCDFFVSAGVNQKLIREFIYSVECPDHIGIANDRDDPTCQFLYVGQLIDRKGVDCLIEALSNINEKNSWMLSVIGTGPAEFMLRGLVNKYQLEDRVRFLGAKTNKETILAIQASDALILPSRWDGWGAVVNEALMVGTPVIVSRACGAASLVNEEKRGACFDRLNVRELTNCLKRFIEQLAIHRNSRSSLRRWANQSLSGNTVTQYFLDCLKSDGPIPCPWRSS